MANSRDWKKAQADRLELQRSIDLRVRDLVAQAEKVDGQDRVWRKTNGGLWWWQIESAGEDKRGSSSAAAAAEPSASSAAATSESAASSAAAAAQPAASSQELTFPSRSAEEDHLTLRHAAMTPASFMPQRHVTMALGRPVVVLIGF